MIKKSLKNNLKLMTTLLMGLLSFDAVAEHPLVEHKLCYIHGFNGIVPFVARTLPRELERRGVPFVVLGTGRGTVTERAERLVQTVDRLLQAQPNLRCHMVGQSMGGIVLRYFANHLQFGGAHALSGRPTHEIILSMMTMSSPHRGTFLADYAQVIYPELGRDAVDLTEQAVERFNDPQSADYSPEIDGIDFHSVASYLDSFDETQSVPFRLGFQMLERAAQRRGIGDVRNDGVIPLRSQHMGISLGSIKAGHDVFTGAEHSNELIHFFEELWSSHVQGRSLGADLLHKTYAKATTVIDNL